MSWACLFTEAWESITLHCFRDTVESRVKYSLESLSAVVKVMGSVTFWFIQRFRYSRSPGSGPSGLPWVTAHWVWKKPEERRCVFAFSVFSFIFPLLAFHKQRKCGHVNNGYKKSLGDWVRWLKQLLGSMTLCIFECMFQARFLYRVHPLVVYCHVVLLIIYIDLFLCVKFVDLKGRERPTCHQR